jgi:hypothetical protein
MTDLTQKRRKPYPSVRKPRKTVFTPVIWVQWMIEKGWSKQRLDERTLHLRAGIAEFRDHLRVVNHTEAQS